MKDRWFDCLLPENCFRKVRCDQAMVDACADQTCYDLDDAEPDPQSARPPTDQRGE